MPTAKHSAHVKCSMNFSRERTASVLHQWVKRITFCGIESSSWLASPGLPGWRVRERADEIFFTAAQNHFTHLMELSRVVQATVKLGICIWKFYNEKLKGGREGEMVYKHKISSLSKYQMQQFRFLHDGIFHNQVKMWSITIVLWWASQYQGTPSDHSYLSSNNSNIRLLYFYTGHCVFFTELLKQF